ncbi:unnamed protein product [Cuscuta campestris]|uniref:Uncharacterized protein n=1 Tax=Cuscuta campestris TaxID=132261 RepID=A0A484NBC2_9ASTE|nr:unnamed protein product [Cuscuta campestris]
MSDREDSQNLSVHSYGSGAQSQTSGSSSSSSSSERPATSPQKQSVDAPTCAPSSSAAQVVSVALPRDEGFIQLDDQLLQEQLSHMQNAQVDELRNLMPDGYQLAYRATWKNIISLHAGTTIGIHYHSIKDLGEFSIHPFKVFFFETYGIMPRQLAPNGHRMLSSFINVYRFLHIPLSLCLFYHMFDVQPGSKETLGFVVLSSHQGRTFLSGLPPSNKKWKDKYVSIKFPPAAFPFAQNAWGKRMKRQVKPRETDDLTAWETTLWAGDTSTRGPYNVGKWGVYPVRETDPELEIVLAEAIPNAIPIRRVKGPKASVSTAASSSHPGKKEKVVKFSSKFATPQIIEEPLTAQPLNHPSGHPFSLDEQPAQSHQGTSQPIHSGELYINVETMEFENLLMESGQQAEGGRDEEEAAEEALQRKRRKTEVVDQPAQSSNTGKEYFTRMVKSKEEEKARLEGMMVACRKDAQTAHLKAEKAEEKLLEHCAAYRKLYAKHEGLLKAAKEADEQAQEKIQRLEAETAGLQEEVARFPRRDCPAWG